MNNKLEESITNYGLDKPGCAGKEVDKLVKRSEAMIFAVGTNRQQTTTLTELRKHEPQLSLADRKDDYVYLYSSDVFQCANDIFDSLPGIFRHKRRGRWTSADWWRHVRGRTLLSCKSRSNRKETSTGGILAM
jgi:hypothetical protein